MEQLSEKLECLYVFFDHVSLAPSTFALVKKGTFAPWILDHLPQRWHICPGMKKHICPGMNILIDQKAFSCHLWFRLIKRKNENCPTFMSKGNNFSKSSMTFNFFPFFSTFFQLGSFFNPKKSWKRPASYRGSARKGGTAVRKVRAFFYAFLLIQWKFSNPYVAS